MEITAKMVKELRDKTKVGLMDCKEALNNAKGDINEAIKILRKKGIAKAAEKSTREAKSTKKSSKVIRQTVVPKRTPLPKDVPVVNP